MSVLSIKDLKKEIGKNIFIHPLKRENINDNTINLTASKFAWSVSTSHNICEDEKTIIIPENDTALIYTNEALYVSNKIGGTYHSKVSMVSKGLGHIGTTLDPMYLGLSLIAIHNHSGKPYKLKVGSTFVSLMFHYLNTPTDNKKRHDNTPGQIELLKEEELDKFNEWSEENNWIKMQGELESEMLNSIQYKELERQNYEDKFHINLLHNHPSVGYIAKSVLIGISIIIFVYVKNTYELTDTSSYILFMLALFTLLLPRAFSFIDNL
ncbi:hypothetical protein [Methanococcoides alaskense]|uniref:Deoxycytidine triphosphate deaminase n=2 Tax=Methanococcoides alaskense TaxID=325778 RepID=A0AA90ZBG4_9EURY|nr:hypothetical protein [Methanococcoides alaskense]MDA0525204.1 hypothetical protein [Methanococcoides alaskense]MDR6221873.1 deoxycytidine triphosphate deaminase [Methanococcoides alaskense]